MKNTPQIPPVLYQYRPPEGLALYNLSMRIVHYGAPQGFNDPFDFLIPPSLRGMTDEQFELLRTKKPDLFEGVPEGKDAFIEHHDRRLAKIHRRACKYWRFACFSACHKNLLMWSHYGGRGKGFCLEYDTAEDWVFRHPAKVIYEKKLPDASDAIEVLTQGENENGVYQGFMAHKSAEWEYEQEWRMLTKNPLLSAEKRYLSKTLKAVYFGVAAEEGLRTRVHAIVKKEYPHAKMWQGKIGDGKYEIKFESPYPEI